MTIAESGISSRTDSEEVNPALIVLSHRLQLAPYVPTQEKRQRHEEDEKRISRIIHGITVDSKPVKRRRKDGIAFLAPLIMPVEKRWHRRLDVDGLLKSLTRILPGPLHIVQADLTAHRYYDYRSSPLSSTSTTATQPKYTLRLRLALFSPAVRPIRGSNVILASLCTALDWFNLHPRNALIRTRTDPQVLLTGGGILRRRVREGQGGVWSLLDRTYIVPVHLSARLPPPSPSLITSPTLPPLIDRNNMRRRSV